MVVSIAGYNVLIDDEDYLRFVENGPWYIDKNKKGLYVRHNALRQYKYQRAILLHRLIINASQEVEIDHINGNTLDNRKCNLRICTHSENAKNRKRNENNTSGYKGVGFLKHNRKWRSRIRVNGKKIYLGCFNTAEEAHRAYCEASKKYHGEYGRMA
jgi:hypothetical protein